MAEPTLGVFGRIYNLAVSATNLPPIQEANEKKAQRKALKNAKPSQKKEVRENHQEELRYLIKTGGEAISAYPFLAALLFHAELALGASEKTGDASLLIDAAIKDIKSRDAGASGAGKEIAKISIAGSDSARGMEMETIVKVRALALAEDVVGETLLKAHAIRALRIEIETGEMSDLAIAEAHAALVVARSYVSRLNGQIRVGKAKMKSRAATAKVEALAKVNRALTRGDPKAVAYVEAMVALDQLKAGFKEGMEMLGALGDEDTEAGKVIKNLKSLVDGFANGEVEVHKVQT